MPDNKLTALCVIGTVLSGDILYIVGDPSCTPLSRQISLDLLHSNIVTTINVEHDWDLGRSAALTDDSVIGNLRFRSFDECSALVNYAKITGVMEVDTVALKQGSMHFFVMDDNTQDTEYMNFNDAGNDFINVFKDINDPSGLVFRVGGTLKWALDGTNANFFNVNMAMSSGQEIHWASSSTRRIFNDTSGFQFNVQSGDNFRYLIDSTEVANISTTGSLFQLEKANADVDICTYGQFWTRDDAPGQTPMWTGDDGTDIALNAGGEVFTWSCAHDAAGNQFNLDGTTMSILGDVACSVMTFHVPSNDTYEFIVDTVPSVTITNFSVDLPSSLVIRWASNNNRLIQNTSSGFNFCVESGDTFDFIVECTGTVMSITGGDDAVIVTIADDTTDAGIVMQNTDGSVALRNTSLTNNEFAPSLVMESAGLSQSTIIRTEMFSSFDSGSAPVIIIEARRNDVTSIANRPLLQIRNHTSVEWEMDKDGNITMSSGRNLILQGSGAAGFIQMGEITDPAAGTNSGKFYVKDVGGLSTPFFIGDGVAATSLLGGGSQTPWDTDIDGAGNNLFNAGVVFLNEQASADGDRAGEGQFWVQDLTGETTAMFTNEGGVDFGISSYKTINFVIDGGGSAITTGIKGQLVVDFDAEVVEWAIIGLPAGAIVVDVSRSTFAGFPTTVTLTATEKPTIAATNDTGEDRALTTWSDINAGDILEFEVDSVATIERCTIALKVRPKGG